MPRPAMERLLPLAAAAAETKNELLNEKNKLPLTATSIIAANFSHGTAHPLFNSNSDFRQWADSKRIALVSC